MKITIIQIGKTKETYLREAEEEYLKRLQSFAKVEIITVNETKISGPSSLAAREQVKSKEAQALLKQIPKDSIMIALDEHGSSFTSAKFADFIQKKRDFEGGNITFVIGGCYGLGTEILAKASQKLSFSSLTFTHEIIRTLLLEQLYRAFTIISGKTYHY